MSLMASEFLQSWQRQRHEAFVPDWCLIHPCSTVPCAISCHLGLVAYTCSAGLVCEHVVRDGLTRLGGLVRVVRVSSSGLVRPMGKAQEGHWMRSLI